MAQFSVHGRATRSLRELVLELVRREYAVLLVSTSTFGRELDWGGDEPDIGILRKPNIGYDFGSWAVGLAACPEILSADRVLFVNDSLIGPFWSLDPILDHFEQSKADAWGLVRSEEIEAHLQSFFFGLRGDALRSGPVRKFWADVGVEPDHDSIVRKYEVGLSRMLYRNSFSIEAMYHSIAVTPLGANATTHAWRELLDSGFPFVKRQIIARPELGFDPERIARVLKTEYDIELQEWLA
ncbi:MAG: rhamnan synthesis F family protein [Pseudoclavibacter sp.]